MKKNDMDAARERSQEARAAFRDLAVCVRLAHDMAVEQVDTAYALLRKRKQDAERTRSRVPPRKALDPSDWDP